MRLLHKAVLLVLGSLAIASALHTSFNEGLDGWVHSSDSKYGGQFEVERIPGLEVKGLKVPEKARHYGITKVIDEVDPAEDLVLQYDLKLASGLSCGGAYLKFLTSDAGFKAADLKDDTPYTVMFGPDKCGATNKVHLILRHKSPKTGKIEEKHLKSPPSVPFDEKTHVYTAILKASDNTYKVLIDGEVKKEGSLYDDFDPPINPPKEIPDPEDKKPADWVDEAKIKDPNAVKPDDWDEEAPAFIPDEDATKPEGWLDDEPAEVDDPEAEKPEDWDDEEDGEWEPPQIPNPKCKEAPGCGEWKRPTKPNPAYKGKWSAPLIDNPAYKGPWSPRNIPNPDHYEDTEPLKHIGKVGAVAIEIWTMDDNYFFDNVVVSNSELEAEELRQTTFKPKKDAEDKAEVDKKAKEEEERKKAEEAEKKKEKKKEKKEQAKSEVESNKEKSVEKAKALLDQLFELPLLQPYASQLAPVREFLEENPLALYLGGGVLATLLLMPLFALLGSGGKKVDAAAVAKKKDITGADDQPAPSGAKKGKNGKAAEAEGEIEEEDDEEEEEEKPARRRAGRRAD